MRVSSFMKGMYPRLTSQDILECQLDVASIKGRRLDE